MGLGAYYAQLPVSGMSVYVGIACHGKPWIRLLSLVQTRFAPAACTAPRGKLQFRKRSALTLRTLHACLGADLWLRESKLIWSGACGHVLLP